jgi:hypothetical protein
MDHGGYGRMLAGGLGVLLIVGGAVWYGMRQKTPPPSPVAVVAAPPPVAIPAPRPQLPATEQADASVRGAAAGLSAIAAYARWLEAGDLVRRFVATVNAIAEGEVPRSSLPFLAPQGRFAVVTHDGHSYVDPAGYQRYDEVANVIASIDPKAAAKAYTTVHELLATAYGEIAPAGTTLDQRLGQAIEVLRSTPVPADPPQLEEAVLWKYSDPKLESLSPASRQLLRMGPRNEKLIQDSLRGLADELHLTPTTAAAAGQQH